MSSSADADKAEPALPPAELPFGWDVFKRKPAPDAMEPESPPAAELARVLQWHRSELAAERGRAHADADAARAVAADLGVLIARLDAAVSRHDDALRDAGLGRVHRELRILKDQMVEALRLGGITIEDPTGQQFENVADRVDVIGWRHGTEYPAEVVAETTEAIVWYGKAVIRPGQVVMGAPPTEGDGHGNNQHGDEHEGKDRE